jgi:hypothetical protein
MKQIQVRTQPSNLGWHFKVVIQEDSTYSEHLVSMDKDFYSRLSTTAEPEKVVKTCFTFLLEKEPVNQIMKEFDVAVIERYFPEFMRELEKRLTYSSDESF